MSGDAVVLGALGWFLVSLRVAVLAHERGHALVAERYTLGDVWIDFGRGPRWLAPRWISALLGLKRTDLWVGLNLASGGRAGHDPICDRDQLIELYAAGYRANFRWAAVCGALTVLVAVGAWALGFDMLRVATVPAIAALASILNGLENVLGRVKPRPGRPDGSDAWNLRGLRRRDPTYSTRHPPTASAIRRSRGK